MMFLLCANSLVCMSSTYDASCLVNLSISRIRAAAGSKTITSQHVNVQPICMHPWRRDILEYTPSCLRAHIYIRRSLQYSGVFVLHCVFYKF